VPVTEESNHSSQTHRAAKRRAERVILDTNVYSALSDSSFNPSLLGRQLAKRRHVVRPTALNLLEVGRCPDLARSQAILRILVGVATGPIFAEPEELIVDSCERLLVGDSSLHEPNAGRHLRRMWERLRSGRDNFVQTQGSFPVLRDKYRVLFSLCRGGWPSDDITRRLAPRGESNGSIVFKQLLEQCVAVPRGVVSRRHAPLWGAAMLAVGLAPQPEIFEAFWRKRHISSTEDRMVWMLGPGRVLMEVGPLVGIGAVLASQAEHGWDTGHAIDCFHLAYLPFVDYFVTNDRGIHLAAKDWPARWKSKVLTSAQWLAVVATRAK